MAWGMANTNAGFIYDLFTLSDYCLEHLLVSAARPRSWVLESADLGLTPWHGNPEFAMILQASGMALTDKEAPCQQQTVLHRYKLDYIEMT